MRLEEGTILVGSYGYDASLSHFYKVKKRTAKQVVLVEMRTREFDHKGFDGWMIEPTDEETGYTLRRKVKEMSPREWLEENEPSEYVDIEDYMRAYPWDGKPRHNYCWH